ncbi:MAG: motility protein A [Deltaproteobacteria bacterium]|nr:motility protein A [Deltaproteobacteria bacterium]
MDKGTVIGLILAVVLIGGAMMLAGSIMMYVDVQSVLVVFGGTFATTLVKDRLPVVMNSIKVGLKAVLDEGQDVAETIETILRLAKVARSSGVLALENEEVPTEFMKKGLRLLCDGMAAEELQFTLDVERFSLVARHKRGQEIFTFMEANAPAMGMIGTLVGLVAMLQKLDNPSAIGPAMAVALLTTMYGAIVAFVICGPIAKKLESRTTEESKAMEIAIQGYVAIAKGDNPMIIREKLNSYLAPSLRQTEEK